MDTSKEFIKMCEKAEEIQKVSPIEKDCGSHWRNKEANIYYVDDGQCYYQSPPNPKGELQPKIWLPHQSQLQDMLNYTVWFEKIYRFYDWLQEKEDIHSWDGNCTKFNTMEQLWLAFVMWELYEKKWNGEEWIV